ncbi:hypothetical protein [Actinomadura oligospora]|nr:hypothetical protein [Actinomadura oligospora]
MTKHLKVKLLIVAALTALIAAALLATGPDKEPPPSGAGRVAVGGAR